MPKGTQYDLDELARLSGLTVRTIRYYIQQRLLHASGHRGPGASYDAGHLARLRLIRRLQADHLPLAEIRRRLETGKTSAPRRAAVEPATDAESDRSHWERIPLAPDVELHVRRPHSRVGNRGVERLIVEARRILRGAEEQRPGAGPERIVVLPEPSLRGLAETVVPRLAVADSQLLGGLAVGGNLGGSMAGGGILSLEGGERTRKGSPAFAMPDAAVRIVLTQRRLADNWFSHWHADSRSAVVSLADWDGTLQVSPVAFVAFETIHHGLRAVAPDFDPLRLAHADTRGCLFDFCETRADIEVKLQAADLCPDCRAGVEQAGLPLERFLRLAETLRSLATDRPTAIQ